AELAADVGRAHGRHTAPEVGHRGAEPGADGEAAGVAVERHGPGRGWRAPGCRDGRCAHGEHGAPRVGDRLAEGAVVLRIARWFAEEEIEADDRRRGVAQEAGEHGPVLAWPRPALAVRVGDRVEIGLVDDREHHVVSRGAILAEYVQEEVIRLELASLDGAPDGVAP